MASLTRKMGQSGADQSEGVQGQDEGWTAQRKQESLGHSLLPAATAKAGLAAGAGVSGSADDETVQPLPSVQFGAKARSKSVRHAGRAAQGSPSIRLHASCPAAGSSSSNSGGQAAPAGQDGSTAEDAAAARSPWPTNRGAGDYASEADVFLASGSSLGMFDAPAGGCQPGADGASRQRVPRPDLPAYLQTIKKSQVR